MLIKLLCSLFKENIIGVLRGKLVIRTLCSPIVCSCWVPCRYCPKMKLSSRTIWSNHYPSSLMVQLARLCTVAEHASKPERRLSCTARNDLKVEANVILKNNCSLMFAGSHILFATGVTDLPYGNVSENLSSVWRTRWFANHGESVRYSLP